MDISADQFEQVWRTSTLSALLCSQLVIPQMLEKGHGNIIFSGSTSAVRGRKGAVDVSSSRFARRGLADAMARELWPQGIHVSHVIIDGVMDTPKVRQNYSLEPNELLISPADVAESYWHLVQQPKSSWGLRLPSGRIQKPCLNSPPIEPNHFKDGLQYALAKHFGIILAFCFTSATQHSWIQTWL